MTLKDLLPPLVVLLGFTCGEMLLAAEIPCETQTLCPENSPNPQRNMYCMTSELWFEAESASGARGDVVGVTISLHFGSGLDMEFTSIDLAVCYDPSMTQLVGGPIYSEEVLARNPLFVEFVTVREDQNPSYLGYGFLSHLGAMADKTPVVGELPLMTVYYRLTGAPGESTGISFCDGSMVLGSLRPCNFSGISNVEIVRNWPLLSIRNLHGSLTIHDGPATHPDRPPEPPEAVVYSEPPTTEEVNLRVRIGNAVAAPGARDVPLDVFVTAGVEYTAVIIPIDFDERYLRVARVEDNFLSGTAILDNEDTMPGAQAEEGYVVLASHLGGTRRIAQAGEELHAATIYIDVLESAAEVTETTLASRSVGGRVPDPFVVVRHLSGEYAEQVEVTSEVGAVAIAGGVLAIRASLETLAGDANLDGRFDISDPVSVLGYLFLGEREPLCPPAADYGGDGRLDISDPIHMLNVLFLGQEPGAQGEAGHVDCR